MRIDDLSDEQKLELKQTLLIWRNDQKGEGTSYEELMNAGNLISEEDLRCEYGGTEFTADDFACSMEKGADDGDKDQDDTQRA